MNYEQTCDMIFSDFVMLESGMRVLTEYFSSLDIGTKEKYKRLLMIKELAKKLKSSVIDDVTMRALIKDTNEFYETKKKSEKLTSLGGQRSFKDIIFDNMYSFDQEIIKCKYIYSNSIIYVDSIKDMHTSHKSIFSHAIDKAKVFQNQFNLIKYFLLENPNFKTKFQEKSEGLEITSLGSLLGTSAEVCVLGMLMMSQEGRIQLQDSSKVVNIDISEIEAWGRGYFTPGCCVLLQGTYKDDFLKAKLIMHPPPVWDNFLFEEKYEKDYFGAITKAFKHGPDDKEIVRAFTSITPGGDSHHPEESYLLSFLNKDLTCNKILYPKNMESQLNINLNLETLAKGNYNKDLTDRLFQASVETFTDECFVIISNPDLMNSSVLAAIERIITMYSQTGNDNILSHKIPFMFVFIGSFTSEDSFASYKTYTTCFDNLANILMKNASIIKGSYIVFVPGPDEFSLFSGFPKHPIIETVISPLRKKIPHILNASNPCRFSMFGKEVVIFRDNLNKKLSRNSIVKCEDVTKQKEFYVHTVLSQGSLSPVDLSVTPRIWHLAQSMTIIPLPDILILADVVEDFCIPMNKTVVANPGNFTKDFSFCVAYPLKNSVEPCKVTLN